jgi:hypothetical protein
LEFHGAPDGAGTDDADGDWSRSDAPEELRDTALSSVPLVFVSKRSTASDGELTWSRGRLTVHWAMLIIGIHDLYRMTLL